MRSVRSTAIDAMSIGRLSSLEYANRPKAIPMGESVRNHWQHGSTLEGRLAALPKVGEPIVVFHNDRMRQMITSQVIRLLTDLDGTLYAETCNSVYRVELGKIAAPPTATLLMQKRRARQR